MTKKQIKYLHDTIIKVSREYNRKVEICRCGNGKRFFFFNCPACNGTGIRLGEKNVTTRDV